MVAVILFLGRKRTFLLSGSLASQLYWTGIVQRGQLELDRRNNGELPESVGKPMVAAQVAGAKSRCSAL